MNDLSLSMLTNAYMLRSYNQYFCRYFTNMNYSHVLNFSDGLRKMNFEFTSAVDDTNVFELPNSIRRIREKMFRSEFLI